MRISWRAALLAAIAIAAPVTATAQASGTDPLDNASLKFGSLGISPAVLLRALGTDANVFNEATDPKRDFTFTVTPRVDVVFHPTFMHLTYSSATDYVYYRKYASERGTNQTSSARIDIPIWRFEPYVLATGTNTRERLNDEVDARARHRDRVYGTGLRVKLATRTSVVIGVRRTTTTFDQGSIFRGENLDRAFNSRTDAAEASLALELTPITTFSLVASDERQRFDLAPERTSETLRVTPTFSFVPDGIISGTIGVGYRRFRTHSPELPDFSGLVANGSIGIRFSSRYRLDTTVGRDLRYSYERDTPYYIGAGGSVALTWQVVGPLDTHVSVRRQSLDYRRSALLGGNVPSDVYLTYGAEVGYRIRSRFRLSVNGDWTDRQSARDASRDFRDHRVYTALTWGKQS